MLSRGIPAFLLILLLISSAVAQDPPPKPAAETAPKSPEKDEAPVVTHHEMKVGDKNLKYTATVGTLPIKDAKGDVEARIFYVAYTLGGEEKSKRPLMFSFNGGPGSSSVWLHMGALAATCRVQGQLEMRPAQTGKQTSPKPDPPPSTARRRSQRDYIRSIVRLLDRDVNRLLT